MARTGEPITYNENEKFSLKDHLFNPKKITQLAGEIKMVYPQFNEQQFIRTVIRPFSDLELKQRIEHIVDCLFEYLPQAYPEALEVILQALPEPLDPAKTDDDFGDFIYEPYNTYIERYGCNVKYLKQSFLTLEQTTQRFSAEFAIRRFIKEFPQETLEKLIEWSEHPNYHVRRLATEGSRPNLPWGGKIAINNDIRIQILDNLYGDPTRYVVRSVANHLNDLSKVNLDLVITTLERWHKEGKQDDKELMYLTKHALRTAIRDGDPSALRLLGYNPQIRFSIKKIRYREKLRIGESQQVSFNFIANQSGKFMIDYVVFFLKKDGSYTIKTFKVIDTTLKKGETISINKKHPFRLMSTKKLYPGVHYFALQINGQLQSKKQFSLLG